MFADGFADDFFQFVNPNNLGQKEIGDDKGHQEKNNMLGEFFSDFFSGPWTVFQ